MYPAPVLERERGAKKQTNKQKLLAQRTEEYLEDRRAAEEKGHPILQGSQPGSSTGQSEGHRMMVSEAWVWSFWKVSARKGVPTKGPSCVAGCNRGTLEIIQGN